MRQLSLIVAFSLVFGITFLSSCGTDIPNAQNLGYRFYNLLMQGKYDEAVYLLDDSALKENSSLEWKNIFKSLRQERGDIANVYTKKAYKFYDQNKNLIVELVYKVDYAFGVYDETLTLIKRKGNSSFKILKYQY